MEPYVDNFDVEGQRGRSLDSSIFSFIRHKSTGKFILDSKDSIFTPPTDESPPQHIIFALRIGQAIRVLKREYLKMLEKGREQDYIDGITHRNIISKENYWKFFLDRQGEPDPLKDYKGTDSFGLVQGVNPRDIRLLIIDYMKSGFTSMLAYKKLFTDSTSNFSLMLRPFAEKRAAQVKAILYNRKQTPKAGR
ncbi:MAG: hypothetical protein H8E12_14750 [Rhodobacteraceae bacterium]|nr:hypothetical protein [Paracoccaceae bacterium]